MTITFTPPDDTGAALHHEAAAGGNFEATQRAISALSAALSQASDHDKILLRAAAGAGKSYALVRMVREALDHANCTRVAVTAFANKQVFPLAEALGKALGPDKVCLFVKADRIPGLPAEVLAHVAVAASSKDIPSTCSVVLGVSHKLGAQGEAGRLLNYLSAAGNGSTPFDVLFVDEAWQLPLHRYTTVEGLAPIISGSRRRRSTPTYRPQPEPLAR